MESAGSACRQTSLSMAGAELEKELSCAEHFSSVCAGMSAAMRSNPYLMPIAAEKSGLSKHDGSLERRRRERAPDLTAVVE
jgi:hypothetical protein